jgi:hypothetical protein
MHHILTGIRPHKKKLVIVLLISQIRGGGGVFFIFYFFDDHANKSGVHTLAYLNKEEMVNLDLGVKLDDS